MDIIGSILLTVIIVLLTYLATSFKIKTDYKYIGGYKLVR